MSHRLIVQWNQWLNQSLGQLVLETEQAVVEDFIQGVYGKHALLIGVPEQQSLLLHLDPPCHLLISPLLPESTQDDLKIIESSLFELPIASGSVDLVILPHTLELVDNPRQLLAEACRIVKPEGHLVICGFNPYSLWGLSRKVSRREGSLPKLHFQNEHMMLKWLGLSDFELVKQAGVLYSPPLKNSKLLKKLHFLEWLGGRLNLPCAGVYVLMAKAKVIPLTPIRMRWKQKLAGVGIPSSVIGPSTRNSNQ